MRVVLSQIISLIVAITLASLDPMAYIRSIWMQGGKTGICKIVPPKEWNSFSSLPDHTQFATRLQKLHMLRHRHRGLNERFKVFIEMHLRARYRCAISLPKVVLSLEMGDIETSVTQEVDFYCFYVIVQGLGGFADVTNAKQWHLVASVLKVPATGKNITNQLKDLYTTSFEEFPSPNNIFKLFPIPRNMLSEIRDAILKYLCRAGDGLSDEGNVDPRDGRDPFHNPVNSFDRFVCVQTRSQGIVCIDGARKSCTTSHQVPVVSCAICYLRIGSKDEVAVCARCGIACHRDCFPGAMERSKLHRIAAWMCHKPCSFGFDSGEKFTLGEYKVHARTFQREWCREKDAAGRPSQANWQSLEAEYWRIVEDPFRSVHVRYGSDLDTGDIGSAFPRLTKSVATYDSKPSSGQVDPWNLNILPSACGSMLKYLPSNIKGITTPWLYCGSLFSTFCYHVEDLNLMSINYMHAADEGSGKLWYGAPPGRGALKFEAALRTSVPGLFEFQPDLQFELVTMVSPVELRDRGAEVYRTIQRPGEFILTFPQSYHGGFSLGFNVGEAVNFFTPECLPWMRAGMNRCHIYRRPSVFCVPEFLICVIQRLGLHADLSATDVVLISKEMGYVIGVEKKRRWCIQKYLAGHYDDSKKGCAQGVECILCLQPCYLSAFQSYDTWDSYCLDCAIEHHARFVPKADSHELVRRKNKVFHFFTLTSLYEILNIAREFCANSRDSCTVKQPRVS